MPQAKRSPNEAHKTRIMVFGTFDMIHSGHRNFFLQARKLAKRPYLIVSIARDKNVLRIKGKLPQNSQFERVKMVGSVPDVDEAVIGGYRDHIPHILKARPEIIALGYDQTAYVKGLRQQLKDHGLMVRVVRLKPYMVEKYKTSLIAKPHKDPGMAKRNIKKAAKKTMHKRRPAHD